MIHDYQRVLDLYQTHSITEIQRELGFNSRGVVSGIIHRARKAGLLAEAKRETYLSQARQEEDEKRQKRLAYHREYNAQRREEQNTKRAARRQANPGHKSVSITQRLSRAISAAGVKAVAPPDRDVWEVKALAAPSAEIYRRAQQRAAKAPAAAPEPLLLSLFDMSDRKCHWIHGEPRQPGYGYCGHETDGSPYCAHHHVLMHPLERPTSARRTHFAPKCREVYA
jgi:hypothetical protein